MSGDGSGLGGHYLLILFLICLDGLIVVLHSQGSLERAAPDFNLDITYEP